MAPKIWSDVRNKWVYPIIFGKFQLYGEEGEGSYNIDISSFIASARINATYNIKEGADCII